MNKLNPYTRDDQLAEVDYSYPYEYESGYADPYLGSGRHDDEKHIVQMVISALKKFWLLILGLNIAATMAAIYYVAQKPNYYKAEARIQVNAEINPAAGMNSGGNPIILNTAGADPAYFATQLQVLEGAGLMRRVIKSLDLENNKDFIDPQRNDRLTSLQKVGVFVGVMNPPDVKSDVLPERKAPRPLSLAEDEPLDPDREVAKLAPFVGLLKGGLRIQPVFDGRTMIKETRLIDVEFTHQDPEIAAKIANAVADAYVLQNLEQKIQSNASAGDFLQKRVAELQAQIRNGEERLINYARENRIVPPDTDQNTVVQRSVELSAQLGQAENMRIAAQTAYQAALQNQMWKSTVESRDSQVIALEGKLNDLRQKLAQLKTEYTDEWYEVVQTKEQISRVESQLEALRKRATDTQLASLRERLVEATEREKLIRQSFEQQRAEVVRQNEAAINYRIIQQEIDTNKSLLSGLLQRTKENEVILTGTPNNVLVLDRALVPGSPSGPERARTVILAFFASLGLGVGLALVFEWFDNSVKHTDNVEKSMGLPLLMTIPSGPESLSEKLFPRKLLPGGWNKKPKRTYDLELFKESHYLECFNQLGTFLLLSGNSRPPKSILVTSAEAGEGKTMTALNLATSLAKSKGRVLLIDADLRCPRIHKLMNLKNEHGLSTILLSGKPSGLKIEEVIQKDPDSNLEVLTAGEFMANPTSLISSGDMEELLETLSKRYEHIVIDSPPVLFFADSPMLSTLVDSVLFIVRDSVSSKQSVQRAKEILQKLGARIAGIVLNAVPVKSTNYYKYTYYEAGDLVAPEGDDQILRL